MNLYQWALKHHVGLDALRELDVLITPPASATEPKPRSEADVAARMRVEAAQHGVTLWRNNVGAGALTNGSFVRFGLANESSEMNSRIKSADYIGIKPVTVTPAHVGMVIGQFVSREAKASDWRYTGTAREEAQRVWALKVLSLGGDACFVTGPGTFR